MKIEYRRLTEKELNTFIDMRMVKCRMRVPFVTQESLFVNENLIL